MTTSVSVPLIYLCSNEQQFDVFKYTFPSQKRDAILQTVKIGGNFITQHQVTLNSYQVHLSSKGNLLKHVCHNITLSKAE